MSDAVELVAKHVHALRYAERGRAVGPKITDEDRQIAQDILDDLIGLLVDDDTHAFCVTAQQYEDALAETKRLRRQLQSVDAVAMSAEQKIHGLMANLAASVDEAKAARDRHVAAKTVDTEPKGE